MTDRRVFGLPVAGLDRTHDDFAGVHARPDLDRRSSFGAQAIAHAPDLVLKPQGRVERTLRMILMRHRRAEQSEDAVASRLNHVTVVAAHRVDHQPERGVDDGSRFFRIEILPEARRVDDVDEERGDELALTLRHEAVIDRVPDGDSRVWCGWARGCGEGRATLVTKARASAIELATSAAPDWQRGPASAAELCRFRVVGVAA